MTLPKSLDGHSLDLLVIGGGIVGAGVARDAAMRGLRVGLVDQFDFAFGTSSRSSRLLHGGLRYLAQGRVRQVREASKEKWILHRIAPHLTAPLPFLFPTRRGDGWPKWKLRIGTKLYDLLCGGRNLGPSGALRPAELLDLVPGLDTDRLTGAVRYYDALTHDARLVLDTLRSAAHHGALLGNYTQFVDASRDGNGWKCQLVDRRDPGGSYDVETRSIVNATGPWSDRLPHSGSRLRLTKGVHLVVDRHRLAVPEAVVMPQGQRILFAIPWGERVILGTTDTDYHGPIESPVCDREDLQYILRVVARHFPAARLSEADVISTWAGLRPLVADRRGRPSDISRRHEISMSEPNWWDVTGGKLTTYRLIAEQTVDVVARALRFDAEPCRTSSEPLVTPAETEGVSQIVPPPLTQQAVQHYCSREWAVHLDDVMVRRTGWHYYYPERQSVAQQVARWMAETLQWDASAIDAEVAGYAAVGTGVASV